MKQIIFFASIALVGCSTIDQPGGRLYSVLAPASESDHAVACTTCDVEWQRAKIWLVRHSVWKIQIADDVQIQTYNPINDDVSYGFTVTKEPVDGGKLIEIQPVCGNMLGCNPSAPAVRKAFYYYISTGNDLLMNQGYLGSIR